MQSDRDKALKLACKKKTFFKCKWKKSTERKFENDRYGTADFNEAKRSKFSPGPTTVFLQLPFLFKPKCPIDCVQPGMNRSRIV